MSKKPEHVRDGTINIPKLLLQSTLTLVAWGVFIFTVAGRLDYSHGWVLLGIGFATLVVILFTLAGMDDLIQERRRPGPGVKSWDRYLIGVYRILVLALLVTALLDSGRFGWTGSLPLWVYLCAGLFLLMGGTITVYAVRVNRFFSSMVRIQSDRGHHVVEDGPYRWIRHPGYLGMMIMIPGLALAMGSLWALIPAFLIDILFILRTALEDRTLRDELQGYQSYAGRVRYRLFPGVW